MRQVFRSWRENVDFDAVRLRDERLRGLYKQRYDARRNVLDWDYTMELLPMASIVHKIHFREWRMTGVAFEVRDSSYSAPNRTMASSVLGRLDGRSVQKRGFWGDVANGPYVATGVDCPGDEKLTNKRNDQHHKSSCDVAYFQMLDWLGKLENGVGFTLKQEDVLDFEYGGSVAGGVIAKGFLGGKGSIKEEEEEEVGWPRLRERVEWSRVMTPPSS